MPCIVNRQFRKSHLMREQHGEVKKEREKKKLRNFNELVITARDRPCIGAVTAAMYIHSQR